MVPVRDHRSQAFCDFCKFANRRRKFKWNIMSIRIASTSRLRASGSKYPRNTIWTTVVTTTRFGSVINLMGNASAPKSNSGCVMVTISTVSFSVPGIGSHWITQQKMMMVPFVH